MRFTDRKTLFTDRIPLLSIRSIRTDRQTVYNHSCHENILSPTNEMRFTDRKTLFTERIPLLSIRSTRTDRHMAYTDSYGAGVLDKARLGDSLSVLLWLLKKPTLWEKKGIKGKKGKKKEGKAVRTNWKLFFVALILKIWKGTVCT